MAVNPTLQAFFGPSATINETTGVVSFDPKELTSKNTPPSFIPLAGNNYNAEQIAAALTNRWSEQYDQSQDSEFQVFLTQVGLVQVPRDGVPKDANQYVMSTRMLNFLDAQLPNPNLL